MTHTSDRLFESTPHSGVETIERLDEVFLRHTERMPLDPIEARRLLAERRLAALGHVGDDGSGGGQRIRPGHARARHGGEQLGGRERTTAQIDGAEHPSRLTARGQPRVTPSTSWR